MAVTEMFRCHAICWLIWLLLSYYCIVLIITINGCDPKKFWNTIKILENKNTSSHPPTLIKSENVVVTDKSKIVDSFNRYFAKAGYAYEKSIPSSNNSSHSPSSVNHSPPPGHPTFSFQPILEAKVLHRAAQCGHS